MNDDVTALGRYAVREHFVFEAKVKSKVKTHLFARNYIQDN